MNLLILLAAIAVLLFFILGLRIQAFVSLLVVSIGFGIVAGLDPLDAVQSVQDGIGGTLGYVATVVGLGAMFGALLEASGGVGNLARAMTDKTSDRGAQWSLAFVGFLISIPIFLDVALIILAPLLIGLAKKSGRTVAYYGLPLTAGLLVTHSFIPPTPGPIAVTELIGADLAWVILIGVICGVPAMILGGPYWTTIALKWIGQDGTNHSHADDEPHTSPADIDVKPVDETLQAGAKAAVIAILMPITLIVLGSTAKYWLGDGNALRSTLEFFGHPFLALIVAVLVTYYFYGVKKQIARSELLRIMTKAMEPAGVVVLITGAGSGFKQILIDSGMGASLADAVNPEAVPIVVFAFLVTLIIRVAQGSATVAMITGAGLTAPVLDAFIAGGAEFSNFQLALIVVSISSGASCLSHVNDSGFWLVSRYLNMNEGQALKAFTTQTTIIGVVGFVMALLLWFLVA